MFQTRKENKMKYINLFLLFAFFLSSCAPAVTTTSTPTPTKTITPAPTSTQTPSPTPTITPTPTPIGGGSGKFIFEYYKVAYEKEFPDLEGDVNVFVSNWDGSNLTPITSGLNNLNHIESISPDGQMVLVSSRSSHLAKGDLYLINLYSTDHVSTKLANGLDGGGQAIFLDNTRIVYIGRGSQGYGFYIVNVDGTGSKKIGAPTGRVWQIVSSDKTRVYWNGSRKEYFRDSSGSLYMYGDIGGLWWTNIDGSGQGKLESNGHQIFPTGIFGEGVAFSPDGTKIAWIPADVEQGCSGALGTFWTPEIRNGTYTESVGRTSQFINKNSPYFGKVIDIPFVEDYVRRCNIMHVAPLSDMDNDTKISLIPPFDPAKDDFFYHKDYSLIWWPDGSKILAYDNGGATWSIIGVTDHYPLALYEIALKDTNPKLTLLKVLSISPMVQSGPYSIPLVADSYTSFRFSSDGRLLLFAKHNPYENFYSAYVNILNLETMNFVDSFGRNMTPDTQVKRVGGIYWLP